MGIPDKSQQVDPASASYRRRIVVKLSADVTLQSLTAKSGRAQLQWKKLQSKYPGLRFEPYFTSLRDEMLHTLSKGALRGITRADARLTAYLALTPPEESDPIVIAHEIAQWPGVETAYVEGGPTPPPVDPSDDPKSGTQGYLDAAPNGIDARWAWRKYDGRNVGIVDLEQGWTLNHEDLVAANIGLISGLNRSYAGHGTAVLGELVAVDNKLGIVGIAPGASARVVSQWRSTTNYNTADAILSATEAMQAGDILLLEAQTLLAGGVNYLPVEVEDAVFDAISAAVGAGIIVVEAGGNGGVDLDLFTNAEGKKILNRASPDFRDSGAIMVGAGSSATPHTRLYFSNYGSRIDCYAWGENVSTTGDGWTGTSTNSYTLSFGGTSGASPIIAAAAAILQSRAKSRSQLLDAQAMRQILADQRNTKSANPAVDRIGVMPDLRATIKALGDLELTDARRWEVIMSILFGVTQDGGGLGWLPGRGPVPIDPWGPKLDRTSQAKRDILLGMAVGEISSLLSDPEQAKTLDNASVELMTAAVRKLTSHR